MESLIEQFGFLASIIGGALQGEIVYLTAMLSVSMGYLNPYSVGIAFFIGSIARDWATFWFARKRGEGWVNKKPKLKTRAEKISHQLERSPIRVLLFYRFIYGFKTVILLVAGISNITWPKFAFWTAISTMLWILVFGWLGYFCAQEVIDQFNAISEYKWPIFIGVGIVAVLYFVFYRLKKFKRDCKNVGIEI